MSTYLVDIIIACIVMTVKGIVLHILADGDVVIHILQFVIVLAVPGTSIVLHVSNAGHSGSQVISLTRLALLKKNKTEVSRRLIRNRSVGHRLDQDDQ